MFLRHCGYRRGTVRQHSWKRRAHVLERRKVPGADSHAGLGRAVAIGTAVLRGAGRRLRGQQRPAGHHGDMEQLRDKSILVVGASGGLGGSIARELAAAGARLTLAGRDRLRLRQLQFPEAAIIDVELTDPNAGRELVEAAIGRQGRLDGLVFAAGVVAFGPATDLDDDIVDQLLLVNYLAPLRLTRAALAVLPPGGFIVNISAVVAEHPLGNMSAYAASKAALTAFDAVARIEGRRKKIRVIDARPPHTETGLADRPIAGQAPKLPSGLDPAAVAQRIVRAIVDDELDLPSSAFSGD